MKRSAKLLFVTLRLAIVVAGSSIPAVSAHAAANEVVLRFDTGGDDLRGGNDNVHVEVLTRTGASVRASNVNGLQRWADHSSHTVRIPLPASTKLEDLAGARIETTFGGGIGGDNWNLDLLRVEARVGAVTRVLFDGRGTPLFRFTGDQRVHLFPFAGVRPGPVPKVMTSFAPERHGFKFVNTFKNIVVSELDIATSGLCGGMAYGALDYFSARRLVPQQNYTPAEGAPLQSYLYNRQTDSVVVNADKWAEYGFNPFGSRNREFFNWGIQFGSGRIGELRDRIDRGQPVPLGLQSCGDACGCPGGCPGSHQVLAIGYELGRYAGDLTSNVQDFSIFVYDPNHPGRTLTLKADVPGAMYQYQELPNERWRAYFVDTKYKAKSPPSIPSQPNELVATFVTGGDDLRGGNDNVHLVLLLRSGTPLRFENINNLKRWINNSSQSISRPLPVGFNVADVVGVRLETTFGGGMGGDNWNLDRLSVEVRAAGAVRPLVNASGAPLVRFTGDVKTREFRL